MASYLRENVVNDIDQRSYLELACVHVTPPTVRAKRKSQRRGQEQRENLPKIMKNIKTIRQEDGKGGGGAGGGPRNLRKAKLAKCAFYGERPYFLSCTETLSLESPFPNTAKASANRNAALQLSPPAVSIRAKIREVRESENVNANRVEFSKKRVKLPVRKT